MIRKSAAVFSLVVGISMMAIWAMLYLTGEIPELRTEPARILLHIAAELATAAALIIAGFGLMTRKQWGYHLYLPAAGALIYTLIQSPGYYLQQGVPGFVLMFAVLLILAIMFLVLVVKHKENLS